MKVQEVSANTFLGWIKKAPAHFKLVLMTPEMALAALTYNTEGEDGEGQRLQRPLSPSWVRELARRMSNGLWALLPEAITFDWNGLCQQGQHRLHAIVESGVSIPMYVKFGEDPALFPKYDGGKKRSPGDIFSMEGVANYTQAAAITRQINVYHSNGYRGSSSGFPTIKTPEETYRYYLEVGPDDVQEGVRLYKMLSANHLPKQSTIAALYVVAHQMTNGRATEFFEAVATGANLGPRSIEKKLRDHLLVNGKDMRPTKVAADVVRAWNAKQAKRRTFSTDSVKTVPELLVA